MAFSTLSALQYHPATRFATIKTGIENLFDFHALLQGNHFVQLAADQRGIGPDRAAEERCRAHPGSSRLFSVCKITFLSALFLLSFKATLIALALLIAARQYNRSGMQLQQPLGRNAASLGVQQRERPEINIGKIEGKNSLLDLGVVLRVIARDHGAAQIDAVPGHIDASSPFQERAMHEIAPRLLFGPMNGKPFTAIQHLSTEAKKGEIDQKDSINVHEIFYAGIEFTCCGALCIEKVTHKHVTFVSGSHEEKSGRQHITSERLIVLIGGILQHVLTQRTVLFQNGGPHGRDINLALAATVLALLGKHASATPAYHYIVSLYPGIGSELSGYFELINESYPAIQQDPGIVAMVERIRGFACPD